MYIIPAKIPIKAASHILKWLTTAETATTPATLPLLKAINEVLWVLKYYNRKLARAPNVAATNALHAINPYK